MRGRPVVESGVEERRGPGSMQFESTGVTGRSSFEEASAGAAVDFTMSLGRVRMAHVKDVLSSSTMLVAAVDVELREELEETETERFSLLYRDAEVLVLWRPPRSGSEVGDGAIGDEADA